MAGFVGRHITLEMFALLLLEIGLSAGLAYLVLVPAGFEGGLRLNAVNHAMVLALTVGMTGFVLGLYRPQAFLRTRSLLLNTALGGAIAFPLAWGATSALGMESEWIVGADRLWPTKILLTWIAALFAIRLTFLAAIRSNLFVRGVVVVGPQGAVADAVAAVRTGRAGFLEVVPPPMPGVSPTDLRHRGIRMALTSRDHLAAMPTAERDGYALAGVSLMDEPTFWERQLRRIAIDQLTPRWFAALDTRVPSRLKDAVNRSGDVVISLGFLVFTLPVMLLVALMVRLDSPGPVLYRQERVGLGGRSFVLLKFRSMRSDAEARGPAWAQQSDPRVTRVGAFMRRTRIDELPQIWNILKGEMSWIGPRPEAEPLSHWYESEIPFYRYRHIVPPGITGWAQVNQGHVSGLEEVNLTLQYDFYYVKNFSPWLDALIVAKTVQTVLTGFGSR